MKNHVVSSQIINLSMIVPAKDEQALRLLARLSIYSIRDLLLHFPMRYQNRTILYKVADLILDTEVVIEGVIIQIERPNKRSRIKLICQLEDESRGRVYLKFFHLLPFQSKSLSIGARLRCYGQVKSGKYGFEIIHPEFQVLHADQRQPIDQYLTPVYPTTEGLSQYRLRKWIKAALILLDHHTLFLEALPDKLIKMYHFPTISAAIKFIHYPPHDVDKAALSANKTRAQERIIFEELLVYRLSLLQLKHQVTQLNESKSIKPSTKLVQSFHRNLLFALTSAQIRVIDEINSDLSQTKPMLRLLQGDVGSGKTVVAATAMLQVVEAGCQVLLMAPTELLAEQHYRVIKAWFEPLAVSVVLLTGQIKGKVRERITSDIASGSASVVIGTHALFQHSVKFSNLALIVIDEQHRFGVQERAILREKGRYGNQLPHQLVMSATPIPRTLAMNFYAGLDCSTIDELPPGRQPIQTSVMSHKKRLEVIKRVHQACHLGKQVYWVCSLIDSSDVIQAQAVSEVFDELKKLLPDLNIAVVHGRLKPSEKVSVMQAFQSGDIHILVATTVIEVGVDVPNASIMIIENAERLGLSQLHQLRGRVGRGSVASYCVLLYQHSLSAQGRARLEVMRDTTDGFIIAKRDLELRGAGEVFGTRQTGEQHFYLADWMRDAHWFSAVRGVADTMMQNQPKQVSTLLMQWISHNDIYAKV